MKPSARSEIAIFVLALAGACRPKERPPSNQAADAAGHADIVNTSGSVPPRPSVVPSTSTVESTPAPAGSVGAPGSPDVRIEIPVSSNVSSLKAAVKVGQTFGILIPNPDPQDWLDAWEVEGCMSPAGRATKCALGEPLAVLPREPDPTQPQSIPPSPRFEIVWKLTPGAIGVHRLEARYIHRTMRTDRGTPTRRVAIEVSVVP